MNKPRIPHASLLFGAALCLGLAVTAGAAEIYVRKDSDKSTEYSDRPEPGSTLMSKSNKPPAQQVPARPAQPSSAKPAATNGNAAASQAAAEAVVNRDVAASNVEQCKQARDDYDKAIRARRIGRQDEKGQVTYLSEQEIAAERVRIQQRVQQTCGSGG